MLTATSNIVFPDGYQDQRNISARGTDTPVSKNEDPSKTQDDKVSLSRRAKELQQTYEKKETVLEQKHASETQRLENEFSQAKSRIEKEYNQKKHALEINLYV